MKNITKSKLTLTMMFLMIGLVSSIAIIVPSNASTDTSNNSIFYMNPLDGEDDGDDDNDGVYDEYEHRNERQIEIQVENGEDESQAEIKSQFYDQNGTENEIEFDIRTSKDGLEIRYGFGTEINDTENELEFKTTFLSIIEFNDTDSNGIYNNSVDDLIQEYLIDDFQPIIYTFENRTDAELHIFTMNTTDGYFYAKLYISNEFALFSDSILAPTEAKIDIGIMNFPYIEDDTKLALMIELEAEAEFEYDNETEDEEYDRAEYEEEFELNVADYNAFFSWSENATIDDTIENVKASPLIAGESDTYFYLNYPHGNIIIHDPKIGMTNLLVEIPESTVNTGIPFFITGSLILIGVFTVSVFGIIKTARKRS